jgi:hypothetical protein
MLCFQSLWWTILAIPVGVYIVIDIFKGREPDKEIVTIGFYTLFSMRRIHTEWGTFWVYLQREKDYNKYYVHILKSGILYLTSVGDSFSYNNMDNMKEQINTILNKECGYEKRINELTRRQLEKKKMIRKSVFKDWNGSTSLQVERDQKLKELI